MLARLFLFVVAGVGGYVLAVVGAFVFWSWTGASGPDYTPLLTVLFLIAPVAGLACGLFAATRPGWRSRREAVGAGVRSPDDLPPAWRAVEAPKRASLPARRNRLPQIVLAIAGAILVGALILASGHVPRFPHIPR